MKGLLALILTGILLVSFSGMTQAQSDDKVGFVNLSKAFDEYEKTKDFDKELEKKGDVKQEQRERLVKEIRTMRDEMELLNEKARESKEKDIEEQVRSLHEFDQDTKTSLIKERDDMIRDILGEMNDIIQAYGERNGYSIILNDRVLLFGAKSLDVTEEIIKTLNDNYKK